MVKAGEQSVRSAVPPIAVSSTWLHTRHPHSARPDLVMTSGKSLLSRFISSTKCVCNAFLLGGHEDECMQINGRLSARIGLSKTILLNPYKVCRISKYVRQQGCRLFYGAYNVHIHPWAPYKKDVRTRKRKRTTGVLGIRIRFCYSLFALYSKVGNEM